MKNRVSLKDIANKVGVSIALVSYVLNGKEKEKRVGEEVVKRIKEAAKELNYQPNQIARSLRGGSTKTIGLIVTDIANPFFGQLARIIEDEAVKNGYTVIFGSCDEDIFKSERLIETFLYRQVDGFIIAPAEGTNNQIAALIEKKLPVVLIDRYFPEIKASSVCLNNFQATFEATNHLIKQGYKHIKMVAYKTSLNHMQERIRGYVEALILHNLNSEIYIIEILRKSLKKETEDLIEKEIKKMENIDALIFATNSLTLSGLYSINRLGIKVPEELGIVGFDGNEAFDFFYAPLSFVEQPLPAIGRKAVNVLLDLINGQSDIVHYNLEHFLNIRNSS